VGRLLYARSSVAAGEAGATCLVRTRLAGAGVGCSRTRFRSSEGGVNRLGVLLVFSVVASAWAGDDAVARGARIYAERCSGCHGDAGRGDGPAAAALVPRPRDFTDATFWRDRTPDALREVVRKGKPGTMMAPFDGVLGDADIDAVVAFLRTFDRGAAPAK
jgi:mono/diheme cytochrome c family protein